jgi:hypothetical protein
LNKMQGYTEQEQIELLEEATLKWWLSVYPKEKGYNTGKQEIMARREVLSQIKIS